ncbi:MAG: DNA replication and repair protein RecF [Candidatus Levybacteria bacterium]|nr:DNA replication and repair protein RecF [Candidatus Levybacteria bacterium]
MLTSLQLQNFRNYKKASFNFDKSVIIIGPNTSGKSNLIEAIFLLSSGKSFRAERDPEMVRFGSEMGRVRGRADDIDLEVVVTVGEVGGVRSQFKRYFVNGVAKRRQDFVGNLPAVLFSPQDLEIVVGSPGLRRDFLDSVLEQTDREYRIALISYTKTLRQRNALLELVKKGLRRDDRQFEYWNKLIITNGQILTAKREDFIDFLNKAKKEVLSFKLEYDKSVISEERLSQYREAETASGITLVGPHRDDFIVYFNKGHDLRSFGSRGQQRLGVLQLKLLELEYVRARVENEPILLLDDVFSELDEDHIIHILEKVGGQQTIITTTHEEFIPARIKSKMEIIELKANN